MKTEVKSCNESYIAVSITSERIHLLQIVLSSISTSQLGQSKKSNFNSVSIIQSNYVQKQKHSHSRLTWRSIATIFSLNSGASTFRSIECRRVPPTSSTRFYKHRPCGTRVRWLVSGIGRVRGDWLQATAVFCFAKLYSSTMRKYLWFVRVLRTDWSHRFRTSHSWLLLLKNGMSKFKSGLL